MANSVFQVPYPTNEPILPYTPGSSEKKAVLVAYAKMYNETIDVPMRIGSKDVTTGETETIQPPHDHKYIIKQIKGMSMKPLMLLLKHENHGVKCPGNLEQLSFLKLQNLFLARIGQK